MSSIGCEALIDILVLIIPVSNSKYTLVQLNFSNDHRCMLGMFSDISTYVFGSNGLPNQ